MTNDIDPADRQTPARAVEDTGIPGDETMEAVSESGTEIAVVDAGPLVGAGVVYDAEIVDDHPGARSWEVPVDLLDFEVPADESRYDLGNDPEFVESVRAWGVLEPVTVYPVAGGRYRVARGRRRVLAARLTGRTVPIAIRDATAPGEAEAMIATIAAEMHTNDRRTDYTHRERANRWAQMSLYGASIARIARDTATGKDEVKAALTAVDSRTAMGAVDSGQLSFEQAAVIAEYEQAGDIDAVQRLLSVPAGEFAGAARRIAADRAQITEQFTQSLVFAERGHPFMVREPGAAYTELLEDDYYEPGHLRTADGDEVTRDVIDTHPALWVVLVELRPESVALDKETGEEVDFDVIDWNTRYYPSRTPAEGKRHLDTVTLSDGWEPEFWLPAEHLDASGLVVREDEDYDTPVPGIVDDQHPATGEDDDSDGPQVSDADREAAAEAAREAARVAAEAARQAEEAQREAERRKRAMVIALNREGEAAKAGRCEFVAQLVARKTLPAGAAAFIAETLLYEPELVNRHLSQSTGLELLGLADREKALKHTADASGNRSMVVVYGLVLGAHEARMAKDHWRADTTNSWWGDGPGYRRYLRHLAEQGHTLELVEQVTAGHCELADIDIDALIEDQKARRTQAQADAGEQKAIAA
ncbi:ParB N-terminal domain-containing protein [Nocardia sp. BMG111209]|uniref:ParB N-terminal domain-containing protein n=1 Tax=Nocardia sp. BMG111209 TaxID=1160137 RepID=UPI000376141C|nr:ParB N-terminal domain-containing protein [Nocardia sp. BMG111209]